VYQYPVNGPRRVMAKLTSGFCKSSGIDLLREHSNVNKHCNQFNKGSRYYPQIEAGMLKDWIIIDCVTSLPTSGI
jgi:hypothetical protein